MLTWVNSEKGSKLNYAWNASPDCVVFSVKQHNQSAFKTKGVLIWRCDRFWGIYRSHTCSTCEWHDMMGQLTSASWHWSLKLHTNSDIWQLRQRQVLQNLTSPNQDFICRSPGTSLIKEDITSLTIWIFQKISTTFPHHQKAFRFEPLSPPPPLMKLTSFYNFGLWDDLFQQNFWWPSKRKWGKFSQNIKILESQPKVCVFVYETLLLTWPTTLPRDQGWKI